MLMVMEGAMQKKWRQQEDQAQLGVDLGWRSDGVHRSSPFTTILTTNASPLLKLVCSTHSLLNSLTTATAQCCHVLLPLLFNDSAPLSSRQILQITRQLGSTTKALDFLEFMRTNAKPEEEQRHCHLLSSVFQSALEVANRNPTSKIEVLKLHGFLKSQNWKIDLSAQSALTLLRCLEGAKMVDDSIFLFKGLDHSAKTSGICNGLLRLLLKSDRIDDALQVLDEMLERDSKFLLNSSTGDIIFEELVKWRDPRGRRFSGVGEEAWGAWCVS
ncbi:hypothetical protein PIB30_043309 [Stylosanthes scabra]|uniref:Pentatricopeptide repeat-containing protein n=1 Tax=Stylosanthes scabra TaxID=79078 RepID=A0ABU6QEX0_9FABA|nr:hypothetical protein [Stylosanthes scabra]